MLFQHAYADKTGRCSVTVKITGMKMPSNLDTHTRISKLKIMGQCERSCGTIGKELVRTSIGPIIVGRKLAELLAQEGWERVPGWKCSYMHRESDLLLSVYVDDVQKKKTDKKAALKPHRIYRGCRQRESETHKRFVMEKSELFIQQAGIIQHKHDDAFQQ